MTHDIASNYIEGEFDLIRKNKKYTRWELCNIFCCFYVCVHPCYPKVELKELAKPGSR